MPKKEELEAAEKKILDTLEHLKESGLSSEEINQNRFFCFKNSTNSSVVNTLTKDCFLRCGSFDQIGHLFNERDNAKYSVSSGSEIRLLASSRNDSNFDFSTIFILSPNFPI